MKTVILTTLIVLLSLGTYAQVSINTNGDDPVASAMLEVTSTSAGMLIPRMTTTQRNAISSPATGLLVFDNTTASFWFYSGSAWVNISSPGEISDADGDTKVQVEESADEDIIRFDLAGTEQWIMQGAKLQPMNSGQSTFIGYQAGQNDDLTNNDNVFIGYQAGKANTTGYSNIAFGFHSLLTNTTGFSNVSIGYEALEVNTEGNKNTAIGQSALARNTTGTNNTSQGFLTLWKNTTGISNTGFGSNALKENAEGDGNTAVGKNALDNATGDGNTATGSDALSTNTTGSNNSAFGNLADVSGINLSNATAIGYNAKVATSNSLVLGGTGDDAVNVGIGTTSPAQTLDVDGDASIDGNTFNVDDNNDRVGIGTNSPEFTLHLQDYAEGVPVMLIENTRNWSGALCDGLKIIAGANTYSPSFQSQLILFEKPNGTNLGEIVQSGSSSVSYNTTSDRRLKNNIRDTHYGLADLMQVKVADYNFKDDSKTLMTGFIAQQLNEHYPPAVNEGGDDPKTDPWNVEYGALTPLLVKAVQEQQETIELLKAENEELKAKVSTVEKLEAENKQMMKANVEIQTEIQRIKAMLGMNDEKELAELSKK